MERLPGIGRRKGRGSWHIHHGMQVVAVLVMAGSLACCRVSAQQAAGVDQLRVLVPLYARPEGE